jgi:hypothetical protein
MMFQHLGRMDGGGGWGGWAGGWHTRSELALFDTRCEEISHALTFALPMSELVCNPAGVQSGRSETLQKMQQLLVAP